jgi:coniferyl-aldehyde dehydrogenase
MLETLSLQRNSYLAEGEVSAATRIDRLQRTIEVLVNNAEKISEAMNADFGCRPRQVNLMTDVTGSLENLKHAKKHLTKWMKAEKRPSMFPLGLLGGRRLFSTSPRASWV